MHARVVSIAWEKDKPRGINPEPVRECSATTREQKATTGNVFVVHATVDFRETAMFFLRKPSYETVRRIIDSQAELDLTYADVGATANSGELPEGFVVDHTRAKLGDGRDAFEAAKTALRSWRQYAFSWLEAFPDDTPLETGRHIATIARAVGLWWVNVCRIVDLADEQTRFGYTYGTLPEHEEQGEERFLIELNEAGEVWYDVLAFSRPQTLLAKIGYPFVRRVQKRFGRDSVAAMKREVETQIAKQRT